MLEAVEAEWKLPFFKYMSTIFFFGKTIFFFKDSITATLYLLNIIGFWPTFGLFHYAKLPSYKRVRWGRLAGPSRMASNGLESLCFICTVHQFGPLINFVADFINSGLTKQLWPKDAVCASEHFITAWALP